MSKITRNQVENTVFSAISSVLPKRMKQKEIKGESHLRDDLNLDSLNLVEIILAVESELCLDLFGKNFEINTVGDFIETIYSMVVNSWGQ